MQQGWRSSGAAVAFGVLVLVGVWALDRFARHEFTVHLRNQAARALALAATAETPYRWRFRRPDDLVAGHPFELRVLAFRDGSLQWQARPQPFEIGVPLARRVDLRNFPQLRLRFDSEPAGEVRLIVRQTLRAPVLASSPTPFATGPFEGALDLRALHWTDARGEATPMPQTAAMLRIRFVPAAAGTLILRDAALQRPPDYVPLDLDSPPAVIDPGQQPPDAGPYAYRLPHETSLQDGDLAAIATLRDKPSTPLLLLPQRARVEQQIALRTAVFALVPNAILLPDTQYRESFAQARAQVSEGLAPTPVNRQWQVVAAFALLLLVARVRPPAWPRWRALLEILLTLAVPTWLIVGGNYDGTLHTPQTVMIGLSLIYAVSLSWPRPFRWIGNRQAWGYAALVAAMALVIGLALKGADNHLVAPPGLRQVVRYLGWALLQQYLISAVCTQRWQIVTGNTFAAAYLGALGFALLHTPNAALMVATFVGGLCWCGIYLRYRALLPLAVSHAVSAQLLSALLPTDILHSAEVSVRFFQ
jgi:hypothetical protein